MDVVTPRKKAKKPAKTTIKSIPIETHIEEPASEVFEETYSDVVEGLDAFYKFLEKIEKRC